MGTITDKLNKLAETKSAIKTAIVNKGVAVSDSDTFASYASKIASISGAEDTYGFSDIGFSAVPDRITNGIAMAKKIYDKVDLTASTWNSAFRNVPSDIYDSYDGFRYYTGTYFPFLEVPDDSELAKGKSEFPDMKSTNIEIFNMKCKNLTISSQPFNNSDYLTEFRLDGNLKFSDGQYASTFNGQKLSKFEVTGTFDISGAELNHFFEGARCDINTTFIGVPSKAEYVFSNMGEERIYYPNIPSMDLTGLTSAEYYTSYCYLCRVGEVKTNTLTSINNFFFSSTIYRIDCIYADSVTDSINFTLPVNCYYMLIKNIGMQESCTIINLSSNGRSWGSSDPPYISDKCVDKQKILDAIVGARQSLVDTFITYSYDRATAGYSTCTVTLHADTKALLTQDEIAQITAKGYTLA